MLLLITEWDTDDSYSIPPVSKAVFTKSTSIIRYTHPFITDSPISPPPLLAKESNNNPDLAREP